MTKIPECVVADFETEKIMPRPQYPPKPVSLALHWPGGGYELMAWGHPSGNTCTEKEARGRYKAARDSKYAMLFQNGMFDQDVAEIAWDIPLLPWERFHDTMFLLALYDPHATSLGLKQSAERLLGIEPEEQDRMYEWLIANVPEAKQKPSEAGAYISRCPYQIVKPYHKGDLTRTEKLFKFLLPRILDSGMGDAYDRERRLMPILLRNARRGMRVDVPALERDRPAMRAGLEKVDGWLRKRLGDINMNSPMQLAEALTSRGAVTELKLTRKGKPSVSKKTLTIDCFKDKRVYHALTYRGQMDTSLSMFVEPWLELSSTDGLLHADWSQVRADKPTGGQKGARSLRIICAKPNLLNIPKKWKKAVVAGYLHPAFVGKLPPLPFMRTYVLPSKGKRWGRRDYNQQEVRLFGHFEEGPVMEGFLRDPKFDLHEGVRAEEEAALVAAGLRAEFDRDSAKGTVFGAFYGQGLTGLMASLKLRDPEDRAIGAVIHKALHRAVPSIKALSDALKQLALQGLPIKTIGGRLYYVEPSQYSEKYGRDMDFYYKLISYLIQGSGADVTKEAIVLYDAHPKREEDLEVTVYDEVDISLPLSDKGARQEMTVLRDCMLAAAKCDVPLLSDGEIGPNWGTLKAFAI